MTRAGDDRTSARSADPTAPTSRASWTSPDQPTSPLPAVLAAAQIWAAEDPDPVTAAELRRLLSAAQSGHEGAAAQLCDAFSDTLQFGTAGLRGQLGPGPRRMNRVVVARAAAGLARHLLEQGHGGLPVVVGHDARHYSATFARDTAEVLAGHGLRPLLCPRPLPTPVVAAAVGRVAACAGVVVTASHNPARDNGFKVYVGDGAQLGPPADAAVAHLIETVGPMAGIPRSPDVEILGEEVVDSYLARVSGLVLSGGPREVAVAYTALHGVGSALMRAALIGAGFPPPHVVDAQDQPDPDFPTVTYPNPEEPGATDLVLELARDRHVDLVLAHDPDADRCAAGIPAPGGGFRMLTGDELGAVLGWWVLQRGFLSAAPVRGTFATSIVSSRLLAAVARAAGLGYRETLTGFKWIARAADDLVYGYEEALGYCLDPTWVRDKDGVSAGLLIAEMTAHLKAAGRTVTDVLDELALEHGVHVTGQVALRCPHVSSLQARMQTLRTSPPVSLGGLRVAAVEDLAQGWGGLPPTDALRYVLGGAADVSDGRVIVRPSGTEPKIKVYLELRAPVDRGAVSETRSRAEARLARLTHDVRGQVAR